eukprot:6181982-Pleurochrysis_carterae.AAC.4
MGKQAGGGEYERGGCRSYTQGEGINNGGTIHVCGTHDRLRDGGRQRSWSFFWRGFLKCVQRGDRGRSANENARIGKQKKETRTREPHPTLYPGEVVGEDEACREPGH